MAICFRCGRSIPPDKPKLRRKVKTGEWLRRNYSSGKPSARNVHYGFRIVCGRCAHLIDQEEQRKERIQFMWLGIALLTLALVILLRAVGIWQ